MTGNLNGRNVIVSGGTDGIGMATALSLAKMGVSLWIIGRDESKTKQALDEIVNASGNEKVGYFVADLSSIASIRTVAARINDTMDHLDVLINNAGALFTQRQTSDDGLEMTYALNHMNYFLLTSLLLDKLNRGTKSRIVNVSSSAHFSGHVNFDDLQSEKSFNSMRVYGTSKLMNVLFTYELDRRLNGSGLTVNALHPGFVDSNFGKSNGGVMKPLFKLIHLGAINVVEGAKTSVYLASSPEVDGVSGKYFDKCKAVRSSKESYDTNIAKRLWEETEEIIKSFS
jgi:NAD(P)-dependent dehydrogenase (short-subunit alcohol dehydrogenase family)